MERYKGYRIPVSTIKSGTLLKKLAEREQKTSDEILHSAAASSSQDSKAIGPLTSTEELLEALDIAIGSDRDDAEGREHAEAESVSTKVETEATVTTPTRRKRRTKKEIEAAALGDTAFKESRFVELTKLLPPVPKKGTFEVNAVKKSLYFFS